MIIKINEKIREIQKTEGTVARPENIAAIFSAILNSESELDQDKEHFWILGLNIRNNIKYIDLVSLGTLFASLVHPREVYRLAVREAVASIIAIHNHPSGDPEPSEEDKSITKRIVEAGKILGIKLVDHVIVTTNPANFVSFKLIGDIY